MTCIRINRLPVSCVLGVHDFERKGQQTVWLDLEIEGSWPGASEQDAIEEALDYTMVSKAAEQLLCEGQFRLLEKAARTLVVHFLKIDGVQVVSVTLTKPGAVPGALGASVSESQTKGSSAF